MCVSVCMSVCLSVCLHLEPKLGPICRGALKIGLPLPHTSQTTMDEHSNSYTVIMCVRACGGGGIMDAKGPEVVHHPPTTSHTQSHMCTHTCTHTRTVHSATAGRQGTAVQSPQVSAREAAPPRAGRAHYGVPVSSGGECGGLAQISAQPLPQTTRLKALLP